MQFRVIIATDPPTHKQTNKQTNKQDRLQYTARSAISNIFALEFFS